MTLFSHHDSHHHHVSSEEACPELSVRGEDAKALCQNGQLKACYDCVKAAKKLEFAGKLIGKNKFEERYNNWNEMVKKSVQFAGDGDLVIWAKQILSKYRDDKTCLAQCGPKKISSANDILPIVVNRDDRILKIKSFI